ncbi:MAG: hypothetical protein BroJett038_27300 [Chloroflexota bacterium]|nr:MAG: hypothetical protein BroJett038_27300 [Chloroflexota bacterium]
MYTVFHIKNFRCFDDLVLDDLARVNLLAGKNNVGKTALLEALFLHCGAYNPALTLNLNAFRGIDTITVEFGRSARMPWDALFNQLDASKSIELTGENSESGRRVLRLNSVRQVEELSKIRQTLESRTNGQDAISSASESVQVLSLEYEEEAGQNGRTYLIFDQQKGRVEPAAPPPPFPGFFLASRVRIPLNDDAQRYGNLVRQRKQNMVVNALQAIESRLISLTALPVGNISIIHGDVGLKELIPLPDLGDGMNRLASIVLAIGNAPNGVVLVDEIENGLHHSILKDVWKAIAKAARAFNTQVFATTHSLECIRAAHQAFSESEVYDFRYHRLDRNEKTNRIEVVTYDQRLIEASIQADFEVR